MSVLESIRKWLDTFPGNDCFQSLKVDYISTEPGNSSIAPSGLMEISRKPDILGNIIVENQYNFALFYVFEKATDDDKGATQNAEWLIDFQNWIQEQNILGLTPVFGDESELEEIKAQNGTIYDSDDEGTAMYLVQLSVTYIKKYEVN